MASREPIASRRAFLGALAVSPLAAGALAAPALGAPSDFGAMVADYRRALAEEKTFGEQVYYPAIKALDAVVAAIPHEIVGVEPYTGIERSTADKEAVAQARLSVRGRYWIDPTYPEVVVQYAYYEQLKAAADRRDARYWEIHIQSGIDDLTTRSDDLADASDKAFGALLAHPVTTSADLATKLEIIDQRGAHDWVEQRGEDEWVRVWDTIIADARRIAVRES